MTYLSLIILLASSLCWATTYQLNGTLTPTDPLAQPAPSGNSATHWHITKPLAVEFGAELGAGALFSDYSHTGTVTGIGLLGNYKLDPHWSLTGEAFFANYGWQSFGYQYAGWGRYYYYETDYNTNEFDLEAGPRYRFSTGKVSPVIGGVLGYAHRYIANYGYGPGYYYNPNPVGFSSDSLGVGPLLGVDFKVTKDVALGLDWRYLFTDSSSPNSELWTFGIRFSF